MPTPVYPAGREYPMFNLPGRTPGVSGGVSTAGVPNFNRLSTSATDNIGSQLTGMPSASPARRASAYFGASSGMPGSDFVRNRGFDLYGEQADKYQQQGLDNFLKLLQGYSGTVMPTTGQQLESQQFNANLGNRQREFDINAADKQQGDYFDRQKWGADRAYNSGKGGEVTDRLGKSLGYNPNYDWSRNPILRGM